MKHVFAIHVGFSKTGTTTLQNHLFCKHSQVEYLGKPYLENNFKDELYRLIMLDSIAYEAEVDGLSLREMVNFGLARMGEEKRVLLISDEMLVSYTKVRDKGVIARRIKDVLAPEKIIITIRNQKHLLQAAYLSRGRLLFNVPPRYSGLAVTFDQWLTLGYEHFHRGYLEHADYARTIAYYSRLFGKENVCVLLLEEFVHNRTGHVNRLSTFLGIDASEAIRCLENAHEHKEIDQSVLYSEALNTRFFPFNKIFPVPHVVRVVSAIRKKLNRDVQACVPITATWEKRLKELYREGNMHLIQEYGLPLEQYDYPL